MTHRRVLSAVLAAAVVTMAGVAALHARSTAAVAPAQLGAAPHPTRSPTVELSQPAAAEATVAERAERIAEATSTDRRLPSRDGRPVDWLAVVGLTTACVAALWTALARRKHRRVATVARWLAPARDPPLLLPS